MHSFKLVPILSLFSFLGCSAQVIDPVPAIPHTPASIQSFKQTLNQPQPSVTVQTQPVSVHFEQPVDSAKPTHNIPTQVNFDLIRSAINVRAQDVAPLPKDDLKPLKLTSLNMQSSSGSGSSGSGGGGHHSSPSIQKETPQPNHTLTLSDIVLTDTGESIVLGSSGEASIRPAFNDSHIVSITINGNFDTAPATTLENMAFLQPDSLALSMVGKDPPVLVLLNDAILWTPVSANSNQIVVTLQTQYIPDLFLKGSDHTLSVHAGQLSAHKRVRVGDPLPSEKPVRLSPVIDSVEVLYDQTGLPVNLKVKGSNFLMAYRYVHHSIDSIISFGHQTAILEENGKIVYETIVHMGDVEAFQTHSDHTISMVTPFGAAFKQCENCQYIFFLDYFLSSGYRVTTARVQLQADDRALLSVNAQDVAEVDFNSTFGTGQFKQLSLSTPFILKAHGMNHFFLQTIMNSLLRTRLMDFFY